MLSIYLFIYLLINKTRNYIITVKNNILCFCLYNNCNQNCTIDIKPNVCLLLTVYCCML